MDRTETGRSPLDDRAFWFQQWVFDRVYAANSALFINRLADYEQSGSRKLGYAEPIADIRSTRHLRDFSTRTDA
jgi:hypothetical protein